MALKSRFMKKIYKILGGTLVAIIAALFLFTKQDLIDFKSQVAKVSVQYDQFARVEYGKPIKVAKVVHSINVSIQTAFHFFSQRYFHFRFSHHCLIFLDGYFNSVY